MITNFLKNKCDIYTEEVVNVNGIEQKVKTPIYTNIGCQYYKTSGKFGENQTAINSTSYTTTCKIEIDKINVRRGQFVEINDDIFGLVGKYIVDLPPKQYTFAKTDMNNITLILKAI